MGYDNPSEKSDRRVRKRGRMAEPNVLKEGNKSEKALIITQAEVVKAMTILADLHAETDRAAVILGTSNLDILLYQILQKYLLPCASSGDDLFEGDGPLSTFRSKIDLSYRLGLIDGACSRALHLIRRIRNDFAHEVSTVALNTGTHRDKVRSLVAKFEGYAPYQGLKEGFFKGKEAKPGDEFRVVVTVILIYLTIINNAIIPLTPLDIPLSVFNIGSEYKKEP